MVFIERFIKICMILALLALGALLFRRFAPEARASQCTISPTLTVQEKNSLDQRLAAALPPFAPTVTSSFDGIPRLANINTTIPNRPRVDVRTYEVQLGDNLFAIADKFGLKPETVLWGNFDILQDNPQTLSPGQELNILPVDGVYYQWAEGIYSRP
jgi:hypothetical protein